MAKMATNKSNSKKQQVNLSGLRKSFKWLFGLLAGSLLMLLLIGSGVWLTGVDTNNWFAIKKLEINGYHYTQGEELYSAIKNIDDLGFFSVDMELVEQKLLDLPWVSKVQLRKQWPEVLQINIEEYQPLAYWGVNGVVATSGEVFYPKQLPEEEWVSLSGPESLSVELTDFYNQHQQQLIDNQLFVTRMHLNERGALSIELDDGLQVELGKLHKEQRLQRLIEQFVLLQEHQDKPLAYLDLRYQNGIAVRWQEQPLSTTSKSN